ncbi:serine protease [Cytobacillus firmus]|uniref:S1C family serine protease n=1 Tax=Cytobacillus firmus TaxID=1399 RepID=UPI00077C4D37|nr:trypsin-like peptidase domain-containing protein [Cytobacillus firmus]MBG9541471.1 serine protease [Cytobacillus firmus]MBG9552118.1 serine protease [Cytobacillus firmus]MBG9559268.1 serine protease [Cytobacillus firmus]MBG9577462.1 serine protease [Cytobacillus firmus]MEC1892310.1 trypsin-like peptidase domain-containing protein [Cytobacillus firmus]
MGYYDQDHQNRYKGQKGNKGGYFLASLVGIILGAILVVVAVPKLADYDVLPYTVEPNEKLQDETTGDNNNARTQNVSVDVTTDVTKAVDKAGDAVVSITNIQTAGFWSNEGNGSAGQPAGTGSGVIYKKEGNTAFIVTNHHVVEGAQELEVSLEDGTKLPARLVGSDIWTDLAVLEVEGKEIKTVAEFGDSDKLKPGEPVIAIGNPLGQFSGSVTQGIISGLERAIPVDIDQNGTVDWQAEVLQTDAAINPGNSGGALVNISGQLIGINSMKIAESAVEGIGLAIPINYARPVIDDLEKFGEVKRPYMGVQLASVNEIPGYYQQEALKLPKDVKSGVAITSVEPNSPAAQAGLKEMDVIVEMDGEEIKDIIELRQHLYTKKSVGDQMKIKFYRDGKTQEVTMKLSGETF